MDLRFELGRLALVNQDIKAANARIAKLASEARALST